LHHQDQDAMSIEQSGSPTKITLFINNHFLLASGFATTGYGKEAI